MVVFPNQDIKVEKITSNDKGKMNLGWHSLIIEAVKSPASLGFYI